MQVCVYCIFVLIAVYYTLTVMGNFLEHDKRQINSLGGLYKLQDEVGKIFKA